MYKVYFRSCRSKLSGHSAAQNIKHLWTLTSGFIGPQILNFERSSACPRCTKGVLYRHAKFLLEALITYYVRFRTKLNQFKHIDHAYLPYHYIHSEKAYNCLMHRPRRRYYIWRRPCYLEILQIEAKFIVILDCEFIYLRKTYKEKFILQLYWQLFCLKSKKLIGSIYCQMSSVRATCYQRTFALLSLLKK